MNDFKTLTIGGTTYTVKDGTKMLPIAFDFWTEESLFSNLQSGTFTLKKNIPYFGDASSEKVWYDNFKEVLDRFPSGSHTISGFTKVGLRLGCTSTGDLTENYNYANAVGASDVEGMNITESGTIKTYELYGKIVFINPYEIFQDTHTTMDPGLFFAEFEYNIEIEYDSSTDTFTENRFEGEFLQYYGELWTDLVNQ